MFRYLLSIFIILLTFTNVINARLVINELMQSNIDCLMDDLNDFPDSWVELYNSGTSTIDLKEYRIGISDEFASAYPLPSRMLAPGEFVLIYCDKVSDGFHTDFRIDSGKGGGIWLFKSGSVEDKVVGLKKQPAPNVAYGRRIEDSDDFGYQLSPTPGKTNCGEISNDILGDAVFSVVGGIVDGPLNLVLSCPDQSPDGAVIRYTLDGSEPTAFSPVYELPIEISATTVVRAKIFKEGWISPRSVTHSYLFHPREATLPVLSIVSDNEYFYGDSIGIYVAGKYDEKVPNYNHDWRRPINLELFQQPGVSASINQLCETRVKGASTRALPLKSLALYANKRFGVKRFDYEFFPSLTPGITNFKSVELRNSGNDFYRMYMRDAVIQQCMGMYCDLDWQPSSPAIVYINGRYMGLLNIRPRSNDDYVYAYYDGLEDIDMVENWWDVKTGTPDSYHEFKNFYREDGHTFDDFNKIMDVEEFCNLMLMNSFFDNYDFPDNNIVMWRPVSDSGRWRWIAKDTDFGLGYIHLPDYPTLKWYTVMGFDGNDLRPYYESRTLLFRKLLDIQEFKDMFINRSAVYLADFLHFDNINSQIDAHFDLLKTEYPYHKEIYNPDSAGLEWEVNGVKDWVQKRWSYFYQHIAEYFDLKTPVTLKIHNEKKDMGSLIVNDIPLRLNEYDGKYFVDRPISVSFSSSKEEQVVLGWKVLTYNNGGSTSSFYEGDSFSFVFPDSEAVEVYPVFTSDSDYVEAVSNEAMSTCFIYDVTGNFIRISDSFSVDDLPKGIYIVRQGNSVRKIKI